MAVTHLFSLLFMFASSLGSGTKNFHTTTATAVYNAQERIMRVEVEVYADNLNELLTAITEQEVDISLVRDQKAANEVLEEYINANFYFVQDGKVLPLTFLEIEIKNDKAFLFLESDAFLPGKITLKNTLFFTLFTDQINIVNMQSGEKVTTYYLTQKTPEMAISL